MALLYILHASYICLIIYGIMTVQWIEQGDKITKNLPWLINSQHKLKHANKFHSLFYPHSFIAHVSCDTINAISNNYTVVRTEACVQNCKLYYN